MICCGSRVPAPRIWTVAAYSLAVINLVGVYLYDLLLYEQGRPPPLPWWAPQISDLLWLACIGALPYQTVPEPPLP